jgi:hypothetical protein
MIETPGSGIVQVSKTCADWPKICNDIMTQELTMEPSTIVLTIAAVGGLAIAVSRLMGIPRPPTWLAIVHGAIALTGLVLLGNTALQSDAPRMTQIAFGIFLLAAAGGATMFFGFHLREKPLPIVLVLGHGLIAITGLVILYMSIGRPHGVGV